MEDAQFGHIGVVGAGTMGVGLGLDLAAHGINVILVDRSEEQLKRAESEIVRLLRPALLLNRKLPRVSAQDLMKRVQLTTDLEALTTAEFIIENVTEDLGTKQAVYDKLDAICPDDVCFAVNTSCISITQLAARVRNPERVLGMHYMNPVYLKACIEVIRGFHTSEATLEKASSLLLQTGKDAIVVNDLPGFVSNRISHLFMNEAAFVVQDQVAEPKDVDGIFRRCYGHKMGPLETADLIGLDTVVHSLDVLYESYQDPKFRVCPLLRKMVHAGKLGVKSGEGFFEYRDQI